MVEDVSTATSDLIDESAQPMPMAELRELFHSLSPEEFRPLARRQEIARWRQTNRFCGVCGAGMRRHDNPVERAMVCPSCGHVAYPAITPAVIVLVENDGRILLQRNSHYGVSYWSLVAGFVDPGENFEEAVRREIREEASIEVRDIRYFGSQCWPFPSNMMVGFRAAYASGTLCPDGEEVIESGWFGPDELPPIPRPHSLARRLIDAWLAERRVQGSR